MALDEPKDDDAVVEHNGIKFVMDTQTTDILRQSGGLTIDYVDEAYRRPQIRRLAERLAREGFGRAELTRLAARAARAEQALAPAIETMLAALPARREAAVFETPAEAILALHDEAIVRLLSREIARIGGAAARLEQVEKIASGLRQKSRFSATLGGVAIRLDAKRLILQPQKPRKRRAES